MAPWIRSLITPYILLNCISIPVLCIITLWIFIPATGHLSTSEQRTYLLYHIGLGSSIMLVATALPMIGAWMRGASKNCARFALSLVDAAARVTAFLEDEGIGYAETEPSGDGRVIQVDGGRFRVMLNPLKEMCTLVCVGPIPMMGDRRYTRLLGLRKALGESNEPKR